MPALAISQSPMQPSNLHITHNPNHHSAKSQKSKRTEISASNGYYFHILAPMACITPIIYSRRRKKFFSIKGYLRRANAKQLK